MTFAKSKNAALLTFEMPTVLYSTVLVQEQPKVPTETALRESERRCIGGMFYGYSIGQQIPGALHACAASKLETNVRVAWQLVDEALMVQSIDVAIPSIALASYQINPSAGLYAVRAEDVMNLAAGAHVAFYCGGEKAMAEMPLRGLSIAPAKPLEFPKAGASILRSDGGWIMRLVDFGKKPLEIRRLEKFWGELTWMPDCSLVLGRHAYNPAVVPVIMQLNATARVCVQ